MDGRVRYDWQSGDTALPGVYFAEWRVQYATGKEATFPNNRHLLIDVLEGIA
jgi:hypothetical protein